MIGTSLVLALASLPMKTNSNSITIESLQEKCGKRTIVYARDTEGVLYKQGTRISDECTSFLHGVIAALEHEGLSCPDWEGGRITDDFLVTVVQLYEEEFPAKEAGS
tara:strand:- start:3655 stop:3975 length:321 start_codon:yes stop_codon:yes gene_type:complete